MSSLFFKPSGSGSGGSGGTTTGLKFIGNYNATTNTPDLTQVSLQNTGDLYIVIVEGTQDLGTGSTLFSVGDNIYWSDGKWNKLQSTVLAEEVIYNSSNVRDVLNGLDTRVDNLEDGAAADQIASEVPYTNITSLLAGTNVQTALDELATLRNTPLIVVDTTTRSTTSATLVNVGATISINKPTSILNGSELDRWLICISFYNINNSSARNHTINYTINSPNNLLAGNVAQTSRYFNTAQIAPSMAIFNNLVEWTSSPLLIQPQLARSGGTATINRIEIILVPLS